MQTSVFFLRSQTQHDFQASPRGRQERQTESPEGEEKQQRQTLEPERPDQRAALQGGVAQPRQGGQNEKVRSPNHFLRKNTHKNSEKYIFFELFYDQRDASTMAYVF